MEIKTVSIIGLGALGILFGNHLSKRMPKEDLRIIAEQDRISKYKGNHVYCNGERCHFNYITPEEACTPADLVIFAVKYNDLNKAIQAVSNQVGEKTIILSLLNGITSETLIGETYGAHKLLYCVAQGMDAVKVDNRLTYEHMGMICFGERVPGVISEKVTQVSDFFKRMAIPFEVETDMYKRLWGKFMLNVGVNQTVAVYETNYGGVQAAGKARDTMIAAMKEVVLLSEKEGIYLTQQDIDYWLKVLGTLSPKGKPSMRQDMEAKRCSEVELFAGEVLKLGQKHNVPTPVNQRLYDEIIRVESTY
ncbi:ketopantoate reductase family protein [Cellulosilyticum sp. I15G10I2]|uniref:ketopantoate reductase family protein n=1 Tax=Cellulosilyticum sp. I15G10I2 TaxID=1892843 RepID=UPI000A535BF8|nr:ketopantoate reductase family protein [Cellulosilyticum sp. I15G10I2]